MLMEKFACPAIGERCRGGVVVCAVVPSEGVTLTRITVDCRVRLVGERLFDLGLRRLGNELVFLSQMHKQGSTKIADLA